MTPASKKLTARFVSTVTIPGLYPDGRGLYLQVSGPTSKSWLYRYTLRTKTRAIGLGSARDDGLSLGDARAKRDELRAMVVKGMDPLQEKRAARDHGRISAAKSITFKEAATEYIATHRAGWRNVKHAAQWTASLERDTYSIIGALPVSEIDTAIILNVLQPIWTAKRETANRLRGRIETILDWAKAREFRSGENPARWRGHLSMLLAARAANEKRKHHAALPFPEVGAFMADLRTRDGIGARALEFAILTAARTSEVLGARWQEIDTTERMWIVPGDRMKVGKEHRVPLSDAALAVLEEMRALALNGDFIFPNIGRGRPLSNMAMLKQLERMNRPDLTVHGFRSTFRDWAAERTNFQNEAIEMALAHAIGNKVEAAYRRGELLDKRRRLMNAWAEFCAAPAVTDSNVLPIRTADAVS
jgi:integrase